jgi:hypothetical protein
MKTTRVLASLALLTAVGASTARADFKDFSWLCSPGAVRTCASLQVYTTLLGSGGTAVTIAVRNLQGTAAWDNTGGSLISRIGLVAPNLSGASGLTVGSIGAQVVGAPHGNWYLASPGMLGGPIELTAGITPGTKTGGIIGCSAPSGGAPGSYFRTCGTGWVLFSFTTTNNWSANNAEVAFLSQYWKVNNGGNECSSVDDGSGRPVCTNVVPEPITMVLLGSGLAGVGGAGLIRRRRGKDVTSV